MKKWAICQFSQKNPFPGREMTISRSGNGFMLFHFPIGKWYSYCCLLHLISHKKWYLMQVLHIVAFRTLPVFQRFNKKEQRRCIFCCTFTFFLLIDALRWNLPKKRPKIKVNHSRLFMPKIIKKFIKILFITAIYILRGT